MTVGKGKAPKQVDARVQTLYSPPLQFLKCIGFGQKCLRDQSALPDSYETQSARQLRVPTEWQNNHLVQTEETGKTKYYCFKRVSGSSPRKKRASKAA